MVLARLKRQTKVGAEEGRAELSDQFLPGIALVSVTLTTEIPIQPVGMADTMDHLMAEGGAIAQSVLETLEGRHLHEVRSRRVEGAPAPVPDVCA
jgi:predicted component of type VI protein secretion system